MRIWLIRHTKKHFELYTKIYGPIAVSTCHIKLAKKDITFLSDVVLILYKALFCMGVQDGFIQFIISAETHYIDDFNVKVKIAVLKQRWDWIVSQSKDWKLVKPEHYIFMASNILVDGLGMLSNLLEKITIIAELYSVSLLKHTFMNCLPHKIIVTRL